MRGFRRRGEGRYEGALEEGWGVVGGALNGGYLMTVAAAVAGAEVPQPDPITVTGHFLGPAYAGPATVLVEVLKRGRGHSTVAARLLRDDRCVLALLATYGDLEARGGAAPTAPPSLPSRERCMRVTKDRAPGTPDIVDRLDLRLDPDLAGFATGRPAGRAEIAGWVRFDEDFPQGTEALLLLADTFPPPVFNLGLLGWVPTVELTVHCRRRPEPGWVGARFRTRFVAGDYLEEDGELWSDDGRLLALSRQLALRPGPRSPAPTAAPGSEDRSAGPDDPG